MTEIKYRIKELRKTLHLTMEKFGNRLGVKKNTVSQWESGKNAVADQIIKSICRECWNGKFVNEEWLRTGVGEMFLELPQEDEIAGYVSDILENKNTPFYKIIIEIMRTFNQLTPENQQVLLIYCKELLKNLQKKEE